MVHRPVGLAWGPYLLSQLSYKIDAVLTLHPRKVTGARKEWLLQGTLSHTLIGINIMRWQGVDFCGYLAVITKSRISRWKIVYCIALVLSSCG